MVVIAFGDISKLLASLDLDTKPFERGSKRVSGDLSKMEGGFGRISTRATALGTAVGVGLERLAEKGISVLFGAIQHGEDSLRVLQDAQAQTNAVIESTGGKAGVSAQQVRDLAESIENLTTADDKAVQQGENLLLTFTGIGKDVFPDATKAMVNMAIALNKGNAETADFDSSAIQLGKALNDPIKGITALRRVGVSFSEQQQKQIKDLVKHGKLQEAQKVILKELQTEFGKAGEAAGKSGASGIRRLNDAVEDAQVALATGLAPALDHIRDEIAKTLSKPETQEAIKHLGEFLGDAAEKGLEFAESIPWSQVADGLKTAAGFAGDLFKAFTNLPPGVQATIVGLAGLNKLSGGGVIKIGVDLFKEGAKGILGAFISRGSPANPMFVVAEGGGLGGAGGAAGAVSGGIGTLGKLFLVGEAIGLIAAVNGVKDSISAGLVTQATTIDTSVQNQINSSKTSFGDLQKSLDAVNTGINDISSNPLNVLVGGDALHQLEKTRTDLAAKIESQEATFVSSFHGSERQEAINAAKITSAQHSSTSQIVGAISRNRPIVNVAVRVSGDTVRVTKNYQSGSNIGTPGGPRTGGQQRF